MTFHPKLLRSANLPWPFVWKLTVNLLYRLLSSFAKDLAEITLIALPEDMRDGQTSKAVQLHSYHDPNKSAPLLICHLSLKSFQ